MKTKDDKTIKVIDQTKVAKFLLDTGLLFEINRCVLHPLGLAICVQADETEENWQIGGLWDCQNDPEGISFSPEALAEGFAKLEKYLAERGGETKIQIERFKRLGYIMQPHPGGSRPEDTNV